MSFHLRNNSSGFTLIEVLISIFIMTFISIGIYQATIETFRLRDRLTIEGEFYNSIRFGLDIIQRDIALVYSPVLILPLKDQPGQKKEHTSSGNPFANKEDPADLPQDSSSSEDLPKKTKYFLEATHPTGIRPSRFQGTKDKMSFLSASHLRVYADSKETEFAKISYELGEDDRKDGLEKGVTTQAIIKSESPSFTVEDDEKDTTFKSFKLLYGVKSLGFRYCQVKDGDCKWFNTWDSDASDTKFKFPDMIEISIEVLGPQRLKFEGKFNFRPEMPLRGLNPSS